MQSSNWKHYLFLLRHALPYRKLAAAQMGLMAASIGVSLLKPWPLKVLVDSVVGDRAFRIAGWNPGFSDTTLLVLACLAYLLLHGGGGMIQFGSTSVAALLSSRMVRDLRAEVLWRLQGLSLRYHDSHRVGDLVYRVAYNTAAAETAFQSGFMGVLKSGIMLVSMFVVMLFMNPLLTVIAMAIVPFLCIAIRWYAKRVHRVSREYQDQEGIVYTRIQEVLSSIRLVLAFGQEKREQTRFEEACEKTVGKRLRSEVVQNGFTFGVALILAGGTALLYWVGIGHVLTGRLTIGEFLVFNAYLAMLYSPLSVLSYTASSVQSALGGGSRVFEILDTEPELENRPDAREIAGFSQSILFDSVSFGYREDVPVIQDVSLEVRRGERVALVGETGGGKSTLLSLLLRFYDPDRGRISLDGIDLRDIRLSDLRKQISYLPQESLLLCASVRENIGYGKPDAGQEEIEAAARAAEAHDFILEFPEGYDTLVGERGVRLSTGQRQRIGLARAFLKPAPILLLDEPTSALDAETETRLVRTIEENMRNRTLLLVAHRLSTIRNVDRIFVMQHGRIVESGSHEELLAHEGAYSRLWKAQNERKGPTGKT